MPDPTDDVELPQATAVRPKRSRISIVWIIPVLAVLVGIGIAVQRIRSEGHILGTGHLRQQNDKFIATQSTHGVRLAHSRHQSTRD